MSKLIALLFSLNAYADDWFCRTQSSETHSWGIAACGVGWGYTEANAREEAFSRAKDELKLLCSLVSCDSIKKVIAGRTDCDKTPAGFKCFRYFEFHMND